MTKLLENIYRCVNIALVNELKLLCLRMGIDIWEVIEAAKTKPFGFQAFYPGPVGALEIPVDPFYRNDERVDFRARLSGAGRNQLRDAIPRSLCYSLGTRQSQKALPRRTRGGARRGIQKDIDDLRESPHLQSSSCCAKRAPRLATTILTSHSWGAEESMSWE